MSAQRSSGACCGRDRATVIATAILQILKTAPACDLRQAIENYLRDELVELERQVAGDRELV